MTETREHSGEEERPIRRARIGLIAVALAIGVVVAAVVLRWSGARGSAVPIPVRPGALAGWNVLLVSLDTLRADHVGCYGYASAATPTLDALAAGGVRCDQAIAPVPLTLPSHATLLTGLNPHHHGARTNGMFRLDDDVTTLAELLKTRGYHTGAVISAYVLDRRYGLAQGFDDYADDLTEGNRSSTFGYRERIAAKANESAIRWLRKHHGEPFLMWLHYFDPHAPYTPPEPYQARFPNQPYDGEIAYVDEQLGHVLAVLDELEVRDRTLVVAVSDHGESLGEHGEWTHGIMIYDATMRVPVIWNAPGALPAGLVVAGQIGLIDVMPTILDLLGEEIPPGLDGVSLLRADTIASAAPGTRELYIENISTKLQYGWAPLMGIRRNDLKFIFAPKPELYDLQADPNELSNLFADRHEQAGQLYERLRGMIGGDPETSATVAGNLPMDAASREKLRSLGYVFKDEDTSTTQRVAHDPKDMMADWLTLQRAEKLADAGRHAECVAVLEPLVRAKPQNARCWEVIGGSYQALGKGQQALAAYRREVQLTRRKVEAVARLASALLGAGKIDEANAELTRAVADDPGSPQALFGLASVRMRQGHLDEAVALYERSIQVGRGSFAGTANFNIGSIHYAAGRLDQARQAFERSLAADPGYARPARALAELLRRNGQTQQAIALLRRTLARRVDAEALVALGDLLAKTKQIEAAIDAMNRALELQPNLFNAHHQLGIVLQQIGRREEAARSLEQAVRINPSDPKARLNLGIALAGLERFAQAETHLRKAVKLVPKSAATHYNLGVLLARQDKLPEAAECFRRTVGVDPRHAGAHNALGQVLGELRRPAEAVRHFRRALEINPKLTSARQNLERCTTQLTTTQSRPAPSKPVRRGTSPTGVR